MPSSRSAKMPATSSSRRTTNWLFRDVGNPESTMLGIVPGSISKAPAATVSRGSASGAGAEERCGLGAGQAEGPAPRNPREAIDEPFESQEPSDQVAVDVEARGLLGDLHHAAGAEPVIGGGDIEG